MICIMSGEVFQTLRNAASRRRSADVGTVLFAQDEPVQSVFLLECGAVRLVRVDREGREAVMHRIAGPSIVAEASLFSERYQCRGEVEDAATLLILPKSRVLRLLEEDARLALSVCRHFGGELHRARARVQILSMRTVAARVDAWFVFNGPDAPARGRWKEWANDLGVSPEALYRELALRRIR